MLKHASKAPSSCVKVLQAIFLLTYEPTFKVFFVKQAENKTNASPIVHVFTLYDFKK